MMKRFLLFILLLPVVSAQLETSELYHNSYLILDTNVESSFQIENTGPDFVSDYVLVSLFFEPIADERLEVLDLSTYPSADKEDGALVYRWETPDSRRFFYGLDARIKTKALHNLIPNKVVFPLKSVPNDVMKYVEPTESVDYADANIRYLANQLAEGEDDLFILTNKVAIHVRDIIHYDLSTVTEQATQPASWVLRNKKGVCDELTNLFLAVMRSLGVPARFVSGVAYTNSDLFDQKWGPHGWAEVYFPGYGWVPFDVTYGQFAWLDPAHIKMKESMDAVEPSTKFEWRGRDMDLLTNSLEFNVDVLEKGPEVDYKINIHNTVMKPSIGFGSYNVIETEVENLNNYYLTTDVILAKTEGISLVGPQQRSVVLKPFQSSKVHWIVKVNIPARDDFIYTFPIMAYDLRNISSTGQFTVSRGEPVFSRADVDRFIRLTAPVEEKSYTKDLSLDCSVDELIFVEDRGKVDCIVKNTGNTVLSNLKVCMSATCTTVKVNIGESQDLQFPIKNSIPGKYVEPITAYLFSGQVETEVYFSLLDEPEVQIINISAPADVHYQDSFDLQFLLKEKSFAAVPAGKTKIVLNNIEAQVWYFTNLDNPIQYTYAMKGADLKPGKNTFRIIVEHPSRGEQTQKITEFDIYLKDLSFTQSLITYLTHFSRWVAGWF